VTGRIHAGAETGVQPGFAILCDDAGVELGLIAGTVAQDTAFLIMDMAVDLIFAGGGVGHSDGDAALLVQHIIKIITAVGPLGHVRGVEAGFAFPVIRVVRLFIDDTFIAPVCQVVHRRGPADIVVEAEDVTVKPVVGTININPPVENVGFAVGDIFPSGKIGIESLHIGYPPVYISC
jgi:hypothetical protein